MAIMGSMQTFAKTCRRTWEANFLEPTVSLPRNESDIRDPSGLEFLSLTRHGDTYARLTYRPCPTMFLVVTSGGQRAVIRKDMPS